MQKLIIKATLKTLAPLTITKDAKLPMMNRLGMGALTQTIYIPGTTFRGKLRHIIGIDQMRESNEMGAPWSLDKAYLDIVGQERIEKKAVKAKKNSKKAEDEDESESKNSDEVDVDFDFLAAKKRREQNHMIDFFGAGLSCSSRIFFGNFMPNENMQPEKFSGYRKDFDSSPDALELLSPADLDDFHNRLKVNSLLSEEKGNIKAIKTQYNKELNLTGANGWKGPNGDIDMDAPISPNDSDAVKYWKTAKLEASEAQKALKDRKTGGLVSTKQVFTINAISAGTEMTSRIIINKATDKDLQLFIRGLNLFSLHPILGGQSARGFGEVSAKFEFTNAEGDDLGVATVGDFKKAQFAGDISRFVV